MTDIEYLQLTVGKKNYPKVKIRNRETCLVCGRKLTNPKSKARGMGPVCWKKWNPRKLLWISESLQPATGFSVTKRMQKRLGKRWREVIPEKKENEFS